MNTDHATVALFDASLPFTSPSYRKLRALNQNLGTDAKSSGNKNRSGCEVHPLGNEPKSSSGGLGTIIKNGVAAGAANAAGGKAVDAAFAAVVGSGAAGIGTSAPAADAGQAVDATAAAGQAVDAAAAAGQAVDATAAAVVGMGAAGIGTTALGAAAAESAGAASIGTSYAAVAAAGGAGAAGIGAGALAAAVVVPVAVLSTPLWLGMFRVRSDIVIRVGKGIKLVHGVAHFTSGNFSSAFPLEIDFPADMKPEEISSFISKQRKTSAKSSLLEDFPETISEGSVCIQYCNAWGSARGCCGMLSYEIEGTGKFLVCLISNPYDRNIHNPMCAVCISDFRVQCNEAQTEAMYQVVAKKLCGYGFAGTDFSTDSAGAFASVKADCFCAEGRMTSYRSSTAYFSITHQSLLSNICTINSVRERSVRIRDASDAGNLAAALLFAMETSFCKRERPAPGRLTYRNGGGGCARQMIVTFCNKQNELKKIVSDNTKLVVLPEGATKIQVQFRVKGGTVVKKIDRKLPKQPWIRSYSGTYETEVLDFECGDGVDAVFLVQGTSLHSYIHKAWDFGRAMHIPPRSWEWWDSDDKNKVAGMMPDAVEIQARLQFLQGLIDKE